MIQENYIDGAIQREIGDWGDATFGKSDASSVLAHLSDELVEVGLAMDALNGSLGAYSPELHEELAEELADCMLLLTHFAHKTGFVLHAPLYEIEPWMSTDAERVYLDLCDLFGILDRGRSPQVARYICVMLHLMAQDYDINLKDEVLKKFTKNKNRKWGEPDERGVVRHINPS